MGTTSVEPSVLEVHRHVHGGDRTATDEALRAILEGRRSIRRLRDGPVDRAALERIADRACLVPAAFNAHAWHVVVVHDRTPEFWRLVELAFRERLEGQRLERYLDRLAGFRTRTSVLLVLEDRDRLSELQSANNIDLETARAFNAQTLGMVQLSLWLGVVTEGLATSLQHWDSHIQADVFHLLEIPAERYRLITTMPVGYPDEQPRAVERPAARAVISFDGYANGGPPQS